MIPEAQVQGSRVAVRIGEIPIQLPLLPPALPAADQLLVVPLCVSELDRCRCSVDVADERFRPLLRGEQVSANQQQYSARVITVHSLLIIC